MLSFSSRADSELIILIIPVYQRHRNIRGVTKTFHSTRNDYLREHEIFSDEEDATGGPLNDLNNAKIEPT